MPLHLLDIILIAIVLISALFAVMRGFAREVLSLGAWIGAALVTYWAISTEEVVAIAQEYIADPKVALAVTGAVAFLVTLILLSYLAVRISDMIADSVIDPIDRTLGLIYGMVRGLLLVVIAYMFYVWLVPVEKHEEWVLKARTLPLIRATAEFVNGFLPEDIAQNIRENMQKQAALQQQRARGGGDEAPVYNRGDKTRLDSLIESQQN